MNPDTEPGFPYRPPHSSLNISGMLLGSCGQLAAKLGKISTASKAGIKHKRGLFLFALLYNAFASLARPAGLHFTSEAATREAIPWLLANKCFPHQRG
jgi:hypothetical protein